jgi:formamidopyrimidine-DNA glycosylase
MPELPEVECVRRGLKPEFVGHSFLHVETRRPDLRFALPPHFVRRLEGQTVGRLVRRAKYLLAHLSGGEVLIMHLGMTGRFGVRHRGDAGSILLGEFARDAGQSGGKHDHIVFRMSGGATVTYNDARRFGFMLLARESELDDHPLFKSLGVEPLSRDLTAGYLAKVAQGSGRDLKAFLMDQRIVAGLGNIYVCEALFRAGLSPNRKASTLAKRNGSPSPLAERLVPAIRTVLEEAIAAGGSTLRDYRRADGSEGAFQDRFCVYGRAGEPCARRGCRGIVRRSIQAGRSSFYCPVCQR